LKRCDGKKHQRPLIPTDECDHVEPLKPSECRRWDAGLTPELKALLADLFPEKCRFEL